MVIESSETADNIFTPQSLSHGPCGFFPLYLYFFLVLFLGWFLIDSQIRIELYLETLSEDIIAVITKSLKNLIFHKR